MSQFTSPRRSASSSAYPGRSASSSASSRGSISPTPSTDGNGDRRDPPSQITDMNEEVYHLPSSYLCQPHPRSTEFAAFIPRIPHLRVLSRPPNSDRVRDLGLEDGRWSSSFDQSDQRNSTVDNGTDGTRTPSTRRSWASDESRDSEEEAAPQQTAETRAGRERGRSPTQRELSIQESSTRRARAMNAEELYGQEVVICRAYFVSPREWKRPT